GKGKVDRPFHAAIEGIFQRLLAQADKAKAVVLEVRYGMAQLFLQITDNQKSHAKLVAGRDQVATLICQLRELEQDHLGNAVFLDRTAETVRPAQNWDLIRSR